LRGLSDSLQGFCFDNKRLLNILARRLGMLDDTTFQGFDSVEKALGDLKAGRLIVVADDADRENEGDLVGIAELMSAESINFMALEGRGLICLTLTEDRCETLDLIPMVQRNTEMMQTAFTVSVDAHPRFGVTTGISAADRATTIQVAVNPTSTALDLVRPGHIFPLRAKAGGVLERVGHTEASVDLARLAGFQPAGVICEILKPDGTMARRDDLREFADRHGLTFITVAQLIAYRLRHERLVVQEAESKLPTAYGEFWVKGYRNTLDGSEHLALGVGNVCEEAMSTETLKPSHPLGPLVRVHSECLTGDILASLRCDCGFQLHGALKQIAESGQGVLIYLRKHEGRGIGLLNKIKAYGLQDTGKDTVEANEALGFGADLRDYGTGAQILNALGVNRFRLLTNNPRKIRGLDGFGLEVTERVPLIVGENEANTHYLYTKQTRLGHWLNFAADTSETSANL
jgi:3,4-dihydroxy 2-butanone 4-phosphate synthase / GTP cyclohydrolase II